MSRPSASGNGAARFAVVGAPTLDGSHLREALAKQGVPGARVDLYGTTRGEVVLSEYAGEARMIQEPELDEVAGHELIFLCECGKLAQRLSAAAAGSVIIDLKDCLPAEAQARRVLLEIEPDVAQDDRRFAVAHPLALVLAEALAPLDRRFGLREAMAVVLRPAADFGDRGVEELRQQTVGLLSFAQVPMELFGGQLAFNILPQADVGEAQRGLEQRIDREVAELLGWSERHFTAKLLTAPMFHGHGLQLRFRLKRHAERDAVEQALEEAGLLPSSSAAVPTPLDVTGEMRTSLSVPSEDGIGGFWMWGVAGATGARGAQQAVRLAAALFDL